jgi:hypothetical protein
MVIAFIALFLLALFETIESNNDKELLRIVSENAMSSLHRCLNFGFDEYTVEDFYNAFMDELQFYQRKLESADITAVIDPDGFGTTAFARMSNPNCAQYLIFWARMLASLYMRENEAEFEPFISHSGGFYGWLRSDVEALNSEADHLQTVALSKMLQVPVTICCFENVAVGGPQFVHTMEAKKSAFELLFRPGHYDVLYRNGDNDVAKDSVKKDIVESNVKPSDTLQSASNDKATDNNVTM